MFETTICGLTYMFETEKDMLEILEVVFRKNADNINVNKLKSQKEIQRLESVRGAWIKAADICKQANANMKPAF